MFSVKSRTRQINNQGWGWEWGVGMMKVPLRATELEEILIFWDKNKSDKPVED